ncbi:MAG: sodium:calcium antiporter [Saprospirales bacterium]|nr:MAG: sodium:calcium antiporter [Saprospirales bacterium]
MFAVAVGFLIKSSDWFIMASEKIGASWGVSPFVIGLTIVAFGTSLPELATAIFAMIEGEPGIVLGNVIGSNITNIFLVLGLLAVVAKSINLDFDLFKNDIPALVISALLFWLMLSDGDIDHFEAVFLLLALGVFIFSSLSGTEDEDIVKVKTGFKTYLIFIVSGALVYFSAKYTIDSIVLIAESINIGTDIIALSLVALGTSLPEVSVSILAAKRGHAGIAVGNVIGSNIFNTYIVIGVAAFFGPLEMTDMLTNFSLPMMLAATFILAVSSLSKSISRWEGFLYLLLYIFFLYRLFI